MKDKITAIVQQVREGKLSRDDANIAIDAILEHENCLYVLFDLADCLVPR